MTQTTLDYTEAALLRIQAIMNAATDAPHPGGVKETEPEFQYGNLLLQITQAFRQLDTAKHESYWYDIVSAAVAGGIKRSALYATECMADEIE